jgi:hypothetical protein
VLMCTPFRPTARTIGPPISVTMVDSSFEWLGTVRVLIVYKMDEVVEGESACRVTRHGSC